MLPLLLALSAPASADLVTPSLPSPPPTAERLAALVAQAAGDPYQLAGLRFTFLVMVDDQEKARRTHTWCPQAGLVQVESDGATTLISAVDGSPVDGADPAAAEAAWGAFINDQYWLLAPSKVRDAGVTRTLGDADWTLDLAFEGVGLTPGDRYSLRVNPKTHRVIEWRFVLQSGREGHFLWRQWKEVGGLAVSTARVSPDGGPAILFPTVEVLDSCPLVTAPTAPPG